MSLTIDEVQEYNLKLVREIRYYAERGEAGISLKNALLLQYKLSSLLDDLVRSDI